MKKSTTALIVAVCLIVAGIAIALAAFSMAGFEFDNLSTDSYVEVEHAVEGDFEHIFIATQVHNIELYLAEDGVCKVVGDESDSIRIKVECDGTSLVIKTEDTRKWYNFIGLSFGEPSLRLYLTESAFTSLTAASDTGHINVPEDFFFTRSSVATHTGAIVFRARIEEMLDMSSDTGSISASKQELSKLEAEASTGKITLENIKAENGVRVKTSTGKIELHEIECNSLNAQLSTGSVTLKNIRAEADIRVTTSTGKVALVNCISMDMHIVTSTGDVIFDGSDAESITVKTDTGDVEGSILTPKIFTTETDTGKVRVPQSANGGRCKIKTDTGDIIITIE